MRFPCAYHDTAVPISHSAPLPSTVASSTKVVAGDDGCRRQAVPMPTSTMVLPMLCADPLEHSHKETVAEKK